MIHDEGEVVRLECGTERILTIGSREPATLQGVEVRAADTAVRDFDVNIVLSPLLGLKGAPFHLALDGLGVLAQPAFKFGGSHCEVLV